MSAATKLRPSWWLELVPLDPPPRMPGLVLVGFITYVDSPMFGLDVDGTGFLFRVDPSGQFAAREHDGSLWRVGRTVKEWECATV